MATTSVGGITVKVDGAAQLRRTLRRAGDDLGDLADLHAQVGGIVAAEAHSWSPRGKTGALDSSIRVGRLKTGAVVRAGFARVPYAGVQEWGWPARNIAPHPYLTTAAKATEPSWTDVYARGVEKIVDKIKGA